MHLSEVERMRLRKEHRMRHGYFDDTQRKFPHDNQDDGYMLLHEKRPDPEDMPRIENAYHMNDVKDRNV